MFGIPIEISMIILSAMAAICGWFAKRHFTGATQREEIESIRDSVELSKMLEDRGLSLEEARQLRDEVRSKASSVSMNIARAIVKDEEIRQSAPTELSWQDTNIGMTAHFGLQLQAVDAQIELIQNELFHSYSEARQEALLASHEAWLAFRKLDARAASLLFEGGTGASAIASARLVEIAEQRLNYLKETKDSEEDM